HGIVSHRVGSTSIGRSRSYAPRSAFLRDRLGGPRELQRRLAHFTGGGSKIAIGALAFAAMVIGVASLARTAPSFTATPMESRAPVRCVDVVAERHDRTGAHGSAWPARCRRGRVGSRGTCSLRLVRPQAIT